MTDFEQSYIRTVCLWSTLSLSDDAPTSCVREGVNKERASPPKVHVSTSDHALHVIVYQSNESIIDCCVNDVISHRALFAVAAEGVE